MKNSDGSISKLEILRDITERKRADEVAQKHQLEFIHVSRLSTIGQMASELAHELNQPLCATMMHLESCLRMVKSDASNMDEIGKKLETTVEQIDRAGKIVSRVKGFAMKSKGKRSTVLSIPHTLTKDFLLTTKY